MSAHFLSEIRTDEAGLFFMPSLGPDAVPLPEKPGEELSDLVFLAAAT